MKMMDIINEDKNRKNEYGCVMLFFDYPAIFKIQDAINPKHLYEEGDDYGIENELHITLLYGLHEEVTTEDIKKVLDNMTFSKCQLYNPSCFNNEKFDVFKFDAKGRSLFDANEKLKKYPYTSDFPEYHPHMTIAYIKPGLGQKYVDMLMKCNGDKHEIKPKYAVFSKVNGTKEKLNIKI